MQNKQKIVVLSIATFLLVSAVVFYFVISGEKTSNDNIPQNIPVDTSSFPSASNSPLKKIPSPDEDKMTLNTKGGYVEIKNLYKNPVEKLSNDGVAVRMTPEYHIYFYPQNQGFLLTIVDPDIWSARNKLESDFLQALEITKDQACQLNVDLGIPASYSPQAAGINYGLSFCPNGKPFPRQ
jgi:hypothetical protein